MELTGRMGMTQWRIFELNADYRLKGLYETNGYVNLYELTQTKWAIEDESACHVSLQECSSGDSVIKGYTNH